MNSKILIFTGYAAAGAFIGVATTSFASLSSSIADQFSSKFIRNLEACKTVFSGVFCKKAKKSLAKFESFWPRLRILPISICTNTGCALGIIFTNALLEQFDPAFELDLVPVRLGRIAALTAAVFCSKDFALESTTDVAINSLYKISLIAGAVSGFSGLLIPRPFRQLNSL